MPEEDKKQEKTEEESEEQKGEVEEQEDKKKQEEQTKEESGLELDLERTEDASKGTNFRSFMEPKIIPTKRVPTLDSFAPPQQENTFNDMLGNRAKKENEKDKTVMNYDIKPLGVNTEKNYIPGGSAGGQTRTTAARVNVGRVNLQTIGRGRLRVGNEFDVRGFQEMARQGMGMGESEEEYKMKAPTMDEIKDKTVFDDKPGFKPRRDYKA